MNLSGIDLRVLSYELQESLVGSWIVNIYHLPNGIFIVKVRKKDVGLQFLLIEPGKRFHLTQFNRTMPKEPSNVCKTLRSHLKDKRINSIEQRDLDRIIEINIGPDEGYTLVIELFGQGNMILVSPLNKIVSALSYRKMRDRDIHPGREFVQMPSQDKDILRNDPQEMETAFDSSEKTVIVLNRWLGLGPQYSRYILKKSNVKKKVADQLTNEEIEKVIFNSIEIRDRIMNRNFEPIVYLDSENPSTEVPEIKDDETIQTDIDEQWDDSSLPFKPEDVVKIQSWPQEENSEDLTTYFPDTLGYAFDVFYSSQESQLPIIEDTEELESGSDRLERLMHQQIAHQKVLFISAEKNQMFGDLLYAHFQPGSELISTIYDARRNNMSWEDIEDRLLLGKEKNISSAKLFQELLPKQGILKLRLPAEKRAEIVEVDFRKSLQENANDFYTKAKKSKRKAKGADIAITNTRQKLENVQNQNQAEAVKAKSAAVLLKRRKAWYEKFHWTKTPQGMLIIGGTDAASNERLVKKYLDVDDIFLHADVQGAPAIVIKTNSGEPNENTLLHAGKLAVSYSSAWKANYTIANAFYVTPDQVSFTPPSGEFLPKGSFMIYGTKSYINDIPLEIYLVLIIERNWARIEVSMNKPDHDLFIKLVPGDTPRGSVAKSIRQRFLSKTSELDENKVKAIDVGEISNLLPGDSKILI